MYTFHGINCLNSNEKFVNTSRLVTARFQYHVRAFLITSPLTLLKYLLLPHKTERERSICAVSGSIFNEHTPLSCFIYSFRVIFVHVEAPLKAAFISITIFICK